jgi:hypothetical protein
VTEDLRIRYQLPVGKPLPDPAPCSWCGKPCQTRADTPFRPDLGAVPLHLICSQWVRDAYRAWKDGRALDSEQMAGMKRLVAG